MRSSRRGAERRVARAIHLARAGRTALSSEGRRAGRLDPPLDREGLAQAAALADAMAEAGAARVFTSPLLRARQTAEAVARRIGASPVIVDDLTDLDLGAWSGLTQEEAAAVTPDDFDWFFRMPQAAEIPGGERSGDAQARVLRALERIAMDVAAGSVVAVTHELPIRFVLLTLRKLEGTAMWDPAVPPGSATRLRISAEGLEIPTVLEDLLRAARR